jgi:hypothetical protein
MGRVPLSARRPALAAVLLSIGAALLAGCGPPPDPPELPAPPASPPAIPSGAVPPTPGGVVPGGPASQSPGFGEQIAVACGGEPGDDEILAVLRDEDLLGSGTEANVVDGPVCSGSWQYTVVSVPERDPLQVVTRGEPGDLELVTAGTDVCIPEVRIQAPPGIRGAAACT